MVKINDITRKKLNKLLGKSIEYRATFVRKDNSEKRALLVDVTYGGKLVTDHAWVDLAMTLEVLEQNTDIKFTAVAYTYKDSRGNRKNGLNKCRNFHLYNEGVEQAKEDNKQRYLRTSR